MNYMVVVTIEPQDDESIGVCLFVLCNGSKRFRRFKKFARSSPTLQQDIRTYVAAMQTEAVQYVTFEIGDSP